MKHKILNILKKNNIANITTDSRLVNENDAFFAIKGTNQDGNNFIYDALKKGAALIFTDQNHDSKYGEFKNKIIKVDNAHDSLNIAAKHIYPNLPQKIVGVTGTNGKSSVVSYVRQILSILGTNSASIGTLGIEISKKAQGTQTIDNNGLTTSDIVNFRKSMHYIHSNGIENAAFEASSHGLHQGRIGDIKLGSAAFVSFSQDHLDYHKNMDDYLQAKLLLFKNHLKQDAVAVINSDINYYDDIINSLKNHKINYLTVGKNGDIKINKFKQTIAKNIINYSFSGKNYQFSTDIVGSFQANNILIAAALVHHMGYDFSEISDTLERVKSVPGRMQRITKVDDDFHVFVDYAHTPDALEKSLMELQDLKLAGGKLYVVFGCGGDRDTSKRAPMGLIAQQNADVICITDDNPRTESPAKIRSDIATNIKNYIEIADRQKAIVEMVAKMRHNDVLLIAGKGHEDYQIIGTEKRYFSDVEIANEVVKNKIK